MTRRCPLCHKPLPEERGPYRPFCSWRCKLLDLGRWLEGSYRLPSPEGESAEGEKEDKEGEPGEETPRRQD